MATSGSTTWSVTAATVVKAALRAIGVLQSGAAPTSSQLADGIEALNFLIKSWQVHGLEAWARATAGPVALTQGQASLTLGPSSSYDVNIPRPLEIPRAFTRDYSGNDQELFRISKTDYWRIPDKDMESTPTQYYYEEGRVSGTLYIWPTPSETYSAGSAGWQLYFDYLRPLEDITASDGSDEIDFPQEWYEAVKYGLAIRLAPEYGKPIPQDLAALAQQAFTLAYGSSMEYGNTIIVPDMEAYMR